MEGDTAERSMTMAASPARVWAVLGDVTRMPEWSEELASVELLDGDGRSVGSRFRGNNQTGTRTWSMTCVVDRYDDGQTLEFHTEDDGGEIRTRWWYRVTPEKDGATVTEGFRRVAKMGRLRAMAERKLIGDRSEYNARNIDASLQRLNDLVGQDD